MSSGISAKAQWNVNEASINRLLKQYVGKNLDNLDKVVDWYARAGSDYIHNNLVLKGSPTGTKWHMYKNMERGFMPGARMDTGLLADNIGYESYSATSDGETGAEFGIPTERFGAPTYFDLQDEGFDIQVKGGTHHVPGINSGLHAHKYLKPFLRRKMLSYGFLSGKKDTRGQLVLKIMGGLYGAKNANFDAAWRLTANELTDSQKRNIEKWTRVLELRALKDLQRQQSADLNRRIIEQSRISSKAGYNAYIGRRGDIQGKAPF